MVTVGAPEAFDLCLRAMLTFGDEVLIQFVKIARETIRENDLIIRFGWDEFILLLPNTSINNAKFLASKIINRISEYNMTNEIKFFVSVGVSDYQEKDLNIDDIIIRADNSLYEAKRAGKNRVIWESFIHC